MPKICFVSVDVEPEFGDFSGIEQLDKILDILRKEQVPATLFVSGEVLEKYPEKFKKLAFSASPARPPQAGGQGSQFEIASHSYTHRFWSELSQDERENELRFFLRVYQEIFGSAKMPVGFRAPSHIIDTAGIKLLEKHGFRYDSSILPHYPFFLKYRGFLGKAPQAPYYPSTENCRRKASPSSELGEIRRVRNSAGFQAKILEIPVTGQMFGIPLVGTWLKRLPFFYFRKLFFLKNPRFITVNLHSWDSLSPKTLQKFEKLLHLLRNKNYQFLTGRKIYESFSQNRG